MILNSIIIENIRSYEHEEIEFPKGITLFEGDIGSGKSTVLMAIEFALFGLGSQKPEALLAKKADSGSVILDFMVGDDKYAIKRTLLRKNDAVGQDSKKSWLRVNGAELPLSASELKQKVLEILKFNEPADPKAESRIFRYAIFTPQEAMKEVLADPKKRKETIRKAFGIEDYSIALGNAKELQIELRTKVGILKERFTNISQIENEINNLKKSIKTEQATLDELQKKILVNEKIQEDFKSRLQELRKRKEQRVFLESEKHRLESEMDIYNREVLKIESEFMALERELEEDNKKLEKLLEITKPDTKLNMSEIDSEIKRYQNINNELIRLQSTKNALVEDISRIKDILGEKTNLDSTELSLALNELEAEKTILKRHYEDIKSKLDSINITKVEKQTEKKSLDKEIENFTKLGNACPTCKQVITESHHHALVGDKKKVSEKLELEIKDATNTFFDLTKEEKDVNSKIESYDLEISKIQKIIPGIDEFKQKTSKLDQIEAEITEISSQMNQNYKDNPVEFLSKLKDTMILYENREIQEKEILERGRRVNEKIKSGVEVANRNQVYITTSRSKIKDIEKELINIGDVNSKLIQIEKEEEENQRRISEISNNRAALSQKIADSKSRLSENESKVAESLVWQTKYKKASEFQVWLEQFFIPTLSQIENQVLKSIGHNFNETYRRWYSMLVEDPTKESRIDEDFTPIVEQDGYEQEVSYLSGGEKTSIALAYRLTLNSLMRKESESMKSNLLILDEPTDGFSKNQLQKIRDLLEELKSEQIVLVSHEKELETYVDNVYKISKEMGVSKILKI